MSAYKKARTTIVIDRCGSLEAAFQKAIERAKSLRTGDDDEWAEVYAVRVTLDGVYWDIELWDDGSDHHPVYTFTVQEK